MSMRIKVLAKVIGGFLLLNGGAFAVPVPIDLSTWSVVQYELNGQPDSSWSLSSGNTVATQSVNADASILLSDFTVSSQQIEGSWRVNTFADDDFMGFVFGYQGRDEYYLFDWKQSDQNDPLGFAERGMSLKVVDVTGGGDPTASDLWPTAGSSNVSVLRHNTIEWSDFTDYSFRLNFTPGLFEIEVKQGLTSLEAWTVADTTFGAGAFGFYNYSQGNVVYSGFTQENDPPPISTVSEPAVLALMFAGLAGIGYRRRAG